MLVDLSAIRDAAAKRESNHWLMANAANPANLANQKPESPDELAKLATLAGLAISHGLEAPPPNPGMAQLLALADRYCTAIQASDKTRQDWRSDIEATPAQDRGGLAAYLRGELVKLVPPVAPKPAPPAVVSPAATPAPAQTWRQHDRADQLHYWSCTQCRTGPKCPEGQRLNDIYIEAATRERFIGANPDPAKPLPKFSIHQPWNEADAQYQHHHGQCPTCKAAARSNGHSDRCATGQALYDLYEQSAPQATKESK